MEQNTWLSVSGRCERLPFIGGNSWVALDQLGYDTTTCLQVHGQWSDENQQQILHLRRPLFGGEGSLHSCTKSDRIVKIDGSVWFLPMTNYWIIF